MLTALCIGPPAPDHRDGLVRQAGLHGNGPVRQAGKRREDPLGRRLPIRERQMKTVLDVDFDRASEGFLFAAVEKPGCDRIVAGANGGVEAVHAVDDAHRLTVNQYGRQFVKTLGQQSDVLLVDSVQPWRIR
ncbi:hypothetical protein OIE67_03375 [Nonomuraea fuscirosea]|nr:hypothetical protein [Nonomuraea fuscirosea]WSA53692.1 hypothetical protein OIE67_03375 [Nonomuraea fuscirosea]